MGVSPHLASIYSIGGVEEASRFLRSIAGVQADGSNELTSQYGSDMEGIVTKTIGSF